MQRGTSSLAVEMAREFDVTLVRFLRENHFNLSNGSSRIHGSELAKVSE
jgi:formate dehydrogenase assembly factor FdhD